MPMAIWVVLTFVVAGVLATEVVTERATFAFFAAGMTLWLTFGAGSP